MTKPVKLTKEFTFEITTFENSYSIKFMQDGRETVVEVSNKLPKNQGEMYDEIAAIAQREGIA